MKNKLLISVLMQCAALTAISYSHAQTATVNTTLKSSGDTSWVINTLKAPSSPSASLIGISPSLVQRPTDPSAFTASLLNTALNPSALPNSYAADFAPAWLFAGQKISFTDFKSNNIGKNIWQTFDVSFAYKNVEDTLTKKTNTTVGFGLKVSLLRGTINGKALQSVNRLYNLTSGLLSKQVAALRNYSRTHTGYRDSLIKATTPGPGQTQAQAWLNGIRDSLYSVVNAQAKASIDSVKSVGESIDFSRYGWKLDLAGGMSYYFPGQVYSNGTLYNAGAWLTGGYDSESSNISILGIARYLYNPQQAYADPKSVLKQSNLNTFDSGLRLLFDTNDSKFTFSGEVIYRSILNNSVVQPSYRYSINTDYKVAKNQLISFVFGRDFDGTINKSGNLLAALNFIIGFGNTKSIQQ